MGNMKDFNQYPFFVLLDNMLDLIHEMVLIQPL